MNKQEAAAFLEMSVRTLERHVARGELNVVHTRGAHGRERTFDRAELERLKASLDTTTYVARPRVVPAEPVASNGASNGTSPEQSLQTSFQARDLAPLGERLISALEGLRSLAGGDRELTPAVELKDKLMLNEREAAAYSGLSVADIERAREGLKSIKTGAGWRVKRESLEAYVREL